jgi:3-hydroxymyristoyl/3-hydroxydecanoyl-(acyl carrier protein) dehydratase
MELNENKKVKEENVWQVLLCEIKKALKEITYDRWLLMGHFVNCVMLQ